jgi:putative copper resistance protein D
MLAPLLLALAASAYMLGVNRTRRRRGASGWEPSRSVWFLAGVAVLAVALVSPIDRYADDRLSVHMVQHLLLMMIAPPLLLLGRPLTLAHAASSGRTRTALAAIGRSRATRILGAPVIGFATYALVLWASHFTSLYEASLTNDSVHAVEHLMYLLSATLFWWPVVARDPGAARLSHPARLLYLFLSMPVMSLLGFVLSSADRVLYPHYVATAGSVALALADQRLAGTVMWEGSMVITMLALSGVLLDWMARDELEARRADARMDRQAHRVGSGAGVPIPAELEGG